jgi:hypothetical protein
MKRAYNSDIPSVVERNELPVPTFLEEVNRIGNLPHIIAIRPVYHGGDVFNEEATRNLIAQVINSAILRLTRDARPAWSDHQINRRVMGTLRAINPMSSGSGFSARIDNIDQITHQKIEGMMEAMHQSNMTLLIYDLEWSFTFNHNIFTRGGAYNVKPPAWMKQNLMSWKPWADEQGPIGCAAVCLALIINGAREEPLRMTFTYTIHLIEQARLVQTEMGWSDTTSLQDFRLFVQKYPKFRLTCLMPVERIWRDYTYVGPEYVEPASNTLAATDPYTAYIYFDMEQAHFAHVKAAQYFIQKMRNIKRLKMCHFCVCSYYDDTGHSCDPNISAVSTVRVKAKKECVRCGKFCDKKCKISQCSSCGSMYEKMRHGGTYHRCIVMVQEVEDKGYNKGENDGKLPSLWVYDLEARIVQVEIEHTYDITGMTDGFYDTQLVHTYSNQVNAQVANLVVAKNVFTGELKQYYGDDCIKDFITFIVNHNKGHSILLAHNAKGYDNRLIFEDLTRRVGGPKVCPVMAGQKFNQITVGSKLIFRDSMLHLLGSLNSLALDYGCVLSKGYFPHLFNHSDNADYSGPIPDIKYYDLSGFAKNERDVELFNEWYEQQVEDKVVWNFKDELKKYCINDVEVLCELTKKYHDIYYEDFKHSPWKYMTSATYAHHLSLVEATKNLELDPKDDNYINRIEELAANDHWAILRPQEYLMARKSLRGGRTGIGCVFYELTQTDKDRGCRIVYQDVVSLYPYQQIAQKYPVGPPVIHVFDDSMYPCFDHTNSFEPCDCEYRHRVVKDSRVYDIRIENEQWTVDQILNDPLFHGFVCATMIPPNIFHPVLVHYDEQTQKCVATCERIEKGFFTSVEFVEALKQGYHIEKLYRFDRYKMAEPLWAEILKKLYITKMVNSRSAPEGQERDDMIKVYDERFDMGDALLKTFDPNIWEKNNARKSAAKVVLNSGWGKHAQRPVMPNQVVIDYTDKGDRERSDTMFQNISVGAIDMSSSNYLAEDKYMYVTKDIGKDVTINTLRKTYLPAACFVPAYGRMQLWGQLNKLGDRVIMYDTDSIVYKYDPELYNIPKGNIIGDWEEEGVSEIGITGFVGIGPKSYAMKLAAVDKKSGIDELVKTKGISQKRATQKILNYDIMKDMVFKALDTGETSMVKVPQTLFHYKMGRGIQVMTVPKVFQFSINDQKGKLDEHGFIYPLGYSAPDYVPHPRLNLE